MGKLQIQRARSVVKRSKRRLFSASLRRLLAERNLRFESLEDRRLLAADITTDLVGHWQLDESEIGQIVVDASSSGNDATHVNITSPDGPNSNAAVGTHSLSTDGVDDYVSVPASPSLDLSGGQFTQSVWILPQHTDDNFHGVLGFHDNGFKQRYPGIWIKQQNKIHAGFGDGTAYRSFSTGSVLTPFAWNHIVTTFNGDEYKVYVDGSEVLSTTKLSGSAPFPTQQFNIGRVDNQFDGLIDDVRIFTRALTQEDVTLLFTSTGSDTEPPTADLVNVSHSSNIDLTVLLTDIYAIDVSTLDNSDIRVTGPLGFDQMASFVSVDDSTDGSPRTATYRVPAPASNGTYFVEMEANQVGDTSGNFVAAVSLGTFQIDDSSIEPNPTGLVANWKLEETSIGQTVVDASGFGNDGVHVNIQTPNGPDTNSAVGQRSLGTDGVDDYVSIAPDASLDLSGGLFTQSVWVYPELADDDFHGVIGYQGNGAAQRYPGIWIKQQDRIHFGFGDGTQWNGFSTESVLTPFAWNHIVTTFDGTNYRAYVDGTEVFATTAAAGLKPYATTQLDIGRIDNLFKGSIDDVRIYKRVLEASEVGLLFNLGNSNPGTIALQSGAFTVNEADGVISIPVVRSGGSDGTVTVSYATVDDTAGSPADYTSVSGTITFLDGQTTQTIDVPVVNDEEIEANETFAIVLNSAGGGAVLGTLKTGVVTILDDEVPKLTLSILTASIGEGDGAAATTATVTRESGDISGPLDVSLFSTDVSEATVPVTVTIPANLVSATFDISAVDDAVADGTRIVTLTATATNFVDGVATIDVTDDEVPTLTVVLAAASIGEADGAAATTATVSRNTEDLTSELVVSLSSSDSGEAAVPTTVTIPANQASVTFNIDAIDDTLADGTQTVTVTASASGYVNGVGTIDVTDNEVPTLTVVIAAASIGEADGAAATTATVSRNTEDLTSELVVSLSSNDSSEAAVPATVTIPANQASVTFDIDAVDDTFADGSQTVIVTASVTGYVDGVGTIDVTDNEVPTLTVLISAPSIGEVDGAAATTATVSRNTEDLTSELIVNLSSNDSGEATVPATVTIPANQASVTFDIDAVDDTLADGSQTVTVTASFTGYVDGVDTIDVTDNEVPTLTVVIAAPSIGEADGAAATTATVSRNTEDLTSELVVNLSSSDSGEATVPATVTIPANQASVTYDIDAVDDTLADGSQTVTLTASFTGYVDGVDTIDVTDNEVPTLTVVIAAPSIGEADGAAATTATVSRNTEDLTSELVVNLSSSDSGEATVPATVTIPANQASVTYDIDAVDDTLADGSQTVTLTASFTGYVDGVDTIDVTDNEVPTLTVVIAAPSIGEADGAAATTATVSRNTEDLTSELIVNLVSSDATEAAVPTTVTIPASQASVTFDIDAVDDTLADGSQTVTVTASFTGYVDGVGTIDVTDNEVPTLTVVIAAPSIGEADGAAATTATVSRNTEDLTSELIVNLVSSDATEAIVPATITIPANQASVTFDIDAVDDMLADGTQTVTVTASGSGYVDGVGNIDVTDDDVPTLVLAIAAASIVETGGAGAATATITRIDQDLTSELVVSLSSSDSGEAAVPATVTIPANQASATFNIDAVDDTLADGSQTVTVTASVTGYVDGVGTIEVTDNEVPTLTVVITAASIGETGGAAATTATVSRNTEDLTSELVVSLSSSDSGEAAVPATVTIPANQASATFNIDAVDDTLADGTQTVTVTASVAGYVDGAGTIDVTDNEVPTLTVLIAAASIGETGGAAATTATVSRNTEDLTSELVVNLVTSDSGEAAVPATVTIPPNQASVTFDIDAVDDTLADGSQTVTVTASVTGYVDGVGTIEVTDNEVPTLTVVIAAPSIGEADGSAATTATVSRNTEDLTSELVVSLSSSDSGEATVPTTVTIPANQASVTFNIDAIDDTLADGTQTVTVTASVAGYVDGVGTIEVTDNEVPTLTVVIAAASIGETGGAAATTATVSRNTEDLTSELIVNLSSSDSGEATVSATVTIPANQASVTYNIDAVDDTLADGTQTVTVTASVAGYVDGVGTIEVTDNEVPTLTVVIAAASIGETGGAAATTATVSRNTEDLTSELVVSLSSSDSGEATVPTTVTIPADQASVTFNIDAIDDTLADGTQTVTVTASVAGYVDGVGTIEVTDNEVPTLTVVIAAASIGETGGAAATTATVSRNTEDLTSELVVSLSSSDSGEAAVPATATIPANQASVTFNIDAVDDALADGTQTITVTASVTGYVDGAGTIEVTDNEVPTLTVVITAASIGETGGAAATTATVSRNTEDLTSELVVSLSSSDSGEASVPATVTIPANQASVTFNIDAVDDSLADGSQTVTVTASVTGYVDGAGTIDVTDNEVPTLTVVITAASIGETDGAAATTATVSRNTEDLTSELVVSLSSSDSGEATVPTTVTIPANQASVTFNIDAIDDTLADGTQTVTVTASAAAYVNGVDIIEVTDNDLLEPDSTGLVAHWKLDETDTGQAVVDASGSGNNATHVNITNPDGPNANAAVGTHSLSTDGVDDYVSVPASPSLDLSGGKFTESVWVLPQHIDDNFHGILGFHGNGFKQRYPGIWIKQQNKIHAGFGDGTEYVSFSTGSVLTPFEWNHIVATFDGTQYKIYVDGAEVYSTTKLSGKTPYPTQQLNIGRIDNQFDGLIDDVRIYNRALDAAEIGLLYNLGDTNPGTISLGAANVNVDEGASVVSIPVVRTGGSDGTVSVDYSTSDSTATSPADYTSVSGTITFLNGETTKTIDVPIIDDNTSDGDKTFGISISTAGGGAALGTPFTGTVTILDNEVPTLTVSIAAVSIGEEAGTAATTATVTRSLDDITNSVVVTLQIDDPSEATVPVSVTIPANQASVTFDIDAIDDMIVDGTQTVTITASATGYVSGNANLNVRDDESVEPDPTGLVGHWRLDETAIGQTVIDSSAAGNDGIHVSLVPPAGPDLSAAVGARSLRTDGVNDFISIPADASLDLSGGQFTESVWIFPENTNSGFHGVLGFQGNGYAQRYPGIWVKEFDKIHAGFGDGTEYHSFSTGSVLSQFDWNHVVTTFDGNLYKLYVDGVEVFSTPNLAGKVPYPTQQLTIGGVDNFFKGLIDDVRVYNRALSPGEVDLLTNLGPPSPGTIQFANNAYSVNESDGTVSVEIVRIGGSEGTVTVDYNTVNGSALKSFDYIDTSGVATFLDGQTSQFITIPIIDDSAGEGNETFSTSLDATGGGAVLGFPRTRLVTIVDDDAPAGGGNGLRGEYYDNSDLTSLKLIRTDPVVDFDWTTGAPAPSVGSDTFSVRWTGQVEPIFTETYAFHTTTDDGVRLWVNGQQIIDQWVNQTATEVSGTIDLVAFNRYDIVLEYFDNTGAASAKLEWSSLSQGLSVIPKSRLYDGSQTGPTISFSANLTNVDEDAGTAFITVLRLGDTSGTSSIDYATSDITATAGSDYTAVSGTLNFAANQASQTISIPISDDLDLEANETIEIALSNPVGAILGTTSTTVAKILDNDPGNFIQETVVQGLNQPTAFRWAPDGRMYLAQKQGTVLVYDTNGTLQNTFIDLSAEVNDASDRGLLDIELHPNFPITPWVYLLYVYEDPTQLASSGSAAPDGNGNRVSRLIRVDADPATNFATAVPGSEVVILGTNSTWANISHPEKDSTGDVTIPPSCGPNGTLTDCLPVDSRSHAIGTVKFSNDGLSLFVSVGDGTSFGIVDPRSARVQDVNSLSGKILRIDPDTGQGFTNNPFYDGDTASNASRVYSYGLRNPFRFALHPVTGEPFIGDVGWTKWEEVNTGAGANFGWPYYEGGSGLSLQTNGYQDLPEAQAFYAIGEPVQEAIHARPHSDGATAIIMGDFYTGNAFPSVYHDALFFADVNEGSIDFITFDGQGNPEPVRSFANGISGIVHMATGPDGNLYFTNISNGTIERFVSGGPNPPGGSGGSGPGGGSAGRPFFVVDSQNDLAYTYESFLQAPAAFELRPEIGDPRGVTSFDGNRVWSVDVTGRVDLFDGGVHSATWTATEVVSAGGIATNGADLWIVDDSLDKVFHFVDGVSLAEGTHAATASFDLDSLNRVPSGIATDGQFIWVVDSEEDKVFKYAASGLPLGNWSLDAANVDPQGIANDPTGFGYALWVVDAATHQVFAYADGANFVVGNQSATSTYPLASQNAAPRGLSTPLPAWMVALLSPNGDDAAASRLPQDVNNDGAVTALDALIIINEISRIEATEGEHASGTNSVHFADVNGDNQITALDALQVINFMTQQHLSTESEFVAQIFEADRTTAAVELTDAALAELGAGDVNKIVSAANTPHRPTAIARIDICNDARAEEADEDVLELLADDLRLLN